MLGTRGLKSVPAALVVAAMMMGSGTAWSKGERTKKGAPVLWIAADRVVGFVPFTVSLYGKVRSEVEPARLEMCREAAMQTDFAGSRGGTDPRATHADRNPAPAGTQERACIPVTLVRSSDGFDYTHEMRFDRPGTYRVRLGMVDATGHRVISNIVQVNAL